MKTLLRKKDAFTLIELIAVITALGLLYALLIPKISNITGLKLRSTTRKVASLIRYTYNEAIARNKKMRVVFDFTPEHNSIWIEEWAESSPTDTLGKEKEVDEEKLSLDEKEKLYSSPKGEFVQVSGPLSKKFIFPEYIQIKGIYLYREEQMIDKDSDFKEISPSIVFFPSGFTQESIVYISDAKERVYSIKIHPITGKPIIYNYHVEPDKI